jgi:hypothetical protein
MTYGAVYLLLQPSWQALLLIVAMHFVIDRWRLARYVCWAKNFLAPPHTVELVTKDGEAQLIETTWWRSWSECQATGYPPETPKHLADWLLILCIFY